MVVTLTYATIVSGIIRFDIALKYVFASIQIQTITLNCLDDPEDGMGKGGWKMEAPLNRSTQQ